VAVGRRHHQVLPVITFEVTDRDRQQLVALAGCRSAEQHDGWRDKDAGIRIEILHRREIGDQVLPRRVQRAEMTGEVAVLQLLGAAPAQVLCVAGRRQHPGAFGIGCVVDAAVDEPVVDRQRQLGQHRLQVVDAHRPVPVLLLGLRQMHDLGGHEHRLVGCRLRPGTGAAVAEGAAWQRKGTLLERSDGRHGSPEPMDQQDDKRI